MDIQVTHPSDGLLDMLIDWVNSDDPEEVSSAVELLLREGPAVNEFLVGAAAKPTTFAQHAFRLLDLVERIGGQRNAATTRRLRELCQHESPIVCQKSKDVLKALRPQKTPRVPRVSVSRAAAQVRKAQIDMAMGRGRLMRRSTIRQWGAMIKSQFLP